MKKIISLLLVIINIYVVSAINPTDLCELMNLGGVTDTMLLNYFIGDTIRFEKKCITNVANKCYRIEPDTIFLHRSKKMEENVDFYVLDKFCSILQYQDKDAYHWENYDISTFRSSKYKKYNYRLWGNCEDILTHSNIIILNITNDNNGLPVMLCKETTTNKEFKYLFQDDGISFISHKLNTFIKSIAPKTLYTETAYSYAGPTKMEAVNLTINGCFVKIAKENKAIIDLDLSYGNRNYIYSEDIDGERQRNLFTRDEYEKWYYPTTIDYRISTSSVHDTAAFTSFLNEEKILFAMCRKYACTFQVMEKGNDDIKQRKVLGPSQQIYIAGIDTFAATPILKGCYLNKVFYIPFNQIDFDSQYTSKNLKKSIDLLAKCPADIQNKYFEYAKWYSYRNNYLKIMEEFISLTNEYASMSGIIIDNENLYDNYGVSTGYKFNITNVCEKPIKYVELYVAGLNSVGDKVLSLGKYIQLANCVGPIQYLESASFDFENLWWSSLVENLEIEKVIIKYFDSTSKTVVKPTHIRKSLLYEFYEEKLSQLTEYKTGFK